MGLKVIIRRPVNEEVADFLEPLLDELRTHAVRQSGYISGETLKRIDGPPEMMVISTWHSIDDWKKWLSSQERIDIQAKIDTLLGKETQYQVYTTQ